MAHPDDEELDPAPPDGVVPGFVPARPALDGRTAAVDAEDDNRSEATCCTMDLMPKDFRRDESEGGSIADVSLRRRRSQHSCESVETGKDLESNFNNRPLIPASRAEGEDASPSRSRSTSPIRLGKPLLSVPGQSAKKDNGFHGRRPRIGKQQSRFDILLDQLKAEHENVIQQNLNSQGQASSSLGPLRRCESPSQSRRNSSNTQPGSPKRRETRNRTWNGPALRGVGSRDDEAHDNHVTVNFADGRPRDRGSQARRSDSHGSLPQFGLDPSRTSLPAGSPRVSTCARSNHGSVSGSVRGSVAASSSLATIFHLFGRKKSRSNTSLGSTSTRASQVLPVEPSHGPLCIDIKKVDQCPEDLDTGSLPQINAAGSVDTRCYDKIVEERKQEHFAVQQVWTPHGKDGSILDHADERNTLYRSTTLNATLHHIAANANAHTKVLQRFASISNIDDGAVVYGGMLSRKLVVRPFSNHRLCWDLVSACLLVYDLVQLPFSIGFDPPRTFFLHFMELTSLTFWTLDVLASFLTGYPLKEFTILSLHMIAIHYMKTWFALDCLLVSFDWYFMIVIDNAENRQAVRMGRTVRTLRILRTLRLVRLLKLRRIFAEWFEHLNSKETAIALRIMLVICGLAIVTHDIACLWYLIGSSQGPDGASWTMANELEDMPLAYKYAISLHWSITQQHGTMEVTASHGSISERVFSVVVVFFAMIMFISFVSILTNSTAELTAIASQHSQDFWMLKRYFRDWTVPKDLSRRIQQYLEYVLLQNQRRVQFHDVKILNLLSGPLFSELLDKTVAIQLRSHAFFAACASRDLNFSGSLEQKSFARLDQVVRAGERAFLMNYVSAGKLQYDLYDFNDTSDAYTYFYASAQITTSTPTMATEIMSHDDLNPGDIVCECALWVEWLHLGDVHCLSECQLICINAEQFGEAVWQNRALWTAVRTYATEFARALNDIQPHYLTDLTYKLFDAQTIVDRSELKANVPESFRGSEQTCRSSVVSKQRSFGMSESYDSDDTRQKADLFHPGST